MSQALVIRGGTLVDVGGGTHLRRRYWLDNYNAVYGAASKYRFEDLRQGFIHHRDFIGQLAKAGGRVVAESDTGAVAPGIGLHREFTNPIPRPSHEEFYGNPLPQIEKISPIIGTEEDAETEISVMGASFQPESVVRLDGGGLRTEFISPTEIKAAIPGRLLRRVGTFPITVTNLKPEGGSSRPVFFMVKFK